MGNTRREYYTATVLGIIALVAWSSLVAVARGVRDEMGVLPSAAVANLVGGAVGLAIGPIRTRRMRHVLRLPLGYLVGCGGLFVLYNLTLFPAVDRAASDAQTVEIGLINYMWPALSLVLAVPLLGKRASVWLWPGLLIATVGASLAVSQGRISPSSLWNGIASNPLPYALAMVGAIGWALYSNLARRWAAHKRDGAVPLFLLATGIGLMVLHAATDGSPRVPLNAPALAELAYLTLFPTLLAYVFWDVAMRKGNVILVVSLSFLTPLMSTLFSCVYLRVPMAADLWLASVMIIVGAAVCQRSLRS